MLNTINLFIAMRQVAHTHCSQISYNFIYALELLWKTPNLTITHYLNSGSDITITERKCMWRPLHRFIEGILLLFCRFGLRPCSSIFFFLSLLFRCSFFSNHTRLTLSYDGRLWMYLIFNKINRLCKCIHYIHNHPTATQQNLSFPSQSVFFSFFFLFTCNE